MITLHTFPGLDGLESLSPFCMKVEVYLKLAKLPYVTSVGNPARAPKGKMPYISQSDGPTIPDSTAILAYLEKRSPAPYDEGMSEQEQARARIVQRMIEEGLYFVLLWTRWADEPGWARMKSVFDFVPSPVRWMVASMVRKRVIGSLHAQGTGRHSREDIYDMGVRDLHALSTYLGDGPHFTGDRLRTVDISAYAFFANIARFDVDTPLRAAIRESKSLTAFLERVASEIPKKT